MADEADAEFEEADRTLKQLRADVAPGAKRIADLQRQLDEAKEVQQHLCERIERGGPVVAELSADARTARQTAEQFPDPAPAIAISRQRLAGIEATNAQAIKRRIACEQLDRIAAEAKDAELQHVAADDVMARLRHLRAHLLDGVDLGVDGLEVGDGELRLNGVSFKQASEAESVRVAAAVVMRQKPRLKLMRVDKCERLDSQSMRLLLSLADANGWQVIATRVADVAALKMEIVEGDA